MVLVDIAITPPSPHVHLALDMMPSRNRLRNSKQDMPSTLQSAFLCMRLWIGQCLVRYGKGNERRLTGLHETSSLDTFDWGVANRGASIRVGRMVPVEKCGYYEDRRPASNLDPYVVTKLIVETTLLM